MSGDATSPQIFLNLTLHTQLMHHTKKTHTNQTSPDLFFLLNMCFSAQHLLAQSGGAEFPLRREHSKILKSAPLTIYLFYRQDSDLTDVKRNLTTSDTL